ncbi:hypothetical protein SCHPADRAFT_992770 [Schizopora paradoxa]|uniref:F-box domain-containing protein n=1 Tax=Schizopora paradoxa TaxID=27342 RepID=A0A0H2SCR1_9AGAM|nr:hypothetical protein SCHPADRAFT_992770 [Schizopora paradoxa]
MTAKRKATSESEDETTQAKRPRRGVVQQRLEPVVEILVTGGRSESPKPRKLSRWERLRPCNDSKNIVKKCVSVKKPVRNTRNLGNLERLLTLPLDIICDIAHFLHPLALLHLAQLTTGFREILMSKSAIRIWRTSLDLYEIPLGPGDINEPQLVDLLFVQGCQACGAPTKAKNVWFELRVRLCKPCMQENVRFASKMAKEIGLKVRDLRTIRTLLPSDNQKYLESDFCDVAEEYLSYEPGSEEQQEFVERRQELTEDLYEHDRELLHWLSKSEKSNDDLSQRQQRQEEFIRRLRALDDYTDDEFQYCRSYFREEWNDIVFQPRPVSEAVWKKYKPKLVGLLAEARKALDEYEKQRQLGHI